MLEDKISVIIPVYKVEPYVRKCIESVAGQTYDRLEIILIDDGSPDRCGEICDECAQNDSRIKVIHRQNGGLSAARNSGLEAATGDYVLFVDSDDYIHKNMVERMHNIAIEKQADVVVCDYLKVNEGEEKEQLQESGEVIDITDDNRLDYMLGDTKIVFTVVWNKLYKRDLFQNICFPEGKVHEDEFVTYKILHQAEKVCYLRDELYYYVQRKSSIMGEGGNVKTLQRLDAFQERIQYYRSRKMMAYEYQMLNHYRYFLTEFINNVYMQGKCTKAQLKPYVQYMRKEIVLHIWKYNISIKTKLGYVLYALTPGIYDKMKHEVHRRRL